ncbi:hypothetical protein G9A89_005794 [Geosiphon pyriformis]|nr:hypothetical protein G9A89_005794 [Geosiphon pyriformis]
MCSRFIKFFENIHLNRTNRVITDFGFSNSYKVLDGLDQGKVFFPLFWRIFYDPFLCKIKSQKHLCGYRIDLRFVAKSDKVELQAEMTSFFAAGAFMNDTIWVDSSQAATQCILDIASKFFALNDISINIEKTVAIFINGKAFKAEFAKSVFRYAILLKCDAIIRKDLKFKMHLPYDFSMTALSHSSFYGIKTFAQMQSEDKLSSSLDLQVASWSPVYLLCHLIRLQINSKNNFLARMVKIFSFCGLFFSTLLTAFHHSVGMPISEVLAIRFLGTCLLAVNVRPYMFINCLVNPVVTSAISEAQTIFLDSGLVLFDVFTDDSLKHFGSCSIVVRAAAFFPKFGLGVGMKVLGVMSSILVELKAIALVLACVPLDSSVFIHSDSQAVLSTYMDELLLAYPDFRKNLWMEHRQIVNFIRRKSLAVAWLKVKGHSGILGNKCANEITSDACWTSFEHYIEQIGKMSLVPKSAILLAALRLYFMKSLHDCLLVAANKRVYCISYLNVRYLFCDKVDTSEHSFMCFSDTLTCNEILSGFCVRWLLLSNVIVSFSMIVQDLSFGAALDALGCFVVAGAIVIDFIRNLALSSNHQLFMKKAEKIVTDGSMSHLVDIVRDKLSVGVVRLLSVDETRGVYSGLHTSCQIFLDMGGMISVVANL